MLQLPGRRAVGERAQPRRHSLAQRPRGVSTAPTRPVTRPRTSGWRAVEEEVGTPDLDVGGSCFPGTVALDNRSHPAYTAFTVEAADYPGLLRVIAWVMNGSGLRVHNAVLGSDGDSAVDTFWVTDIRGRKLKDHIAQEVAERLQDFVNICQPDESDDEFMEYNCGAIEVSNSAHPTSTQVTVTADIFSPGLLLELASVISGQGISISEAVIRGGPDNPIPSAAAAALPSVPDPPPGKRVMRFWLRTARGQRKLGLAEVSGLVYTMSLVLGQGAAPTSPPNTRTNIGCNSGGCA